VIKNILILFFLLVTFSWGTVPIITTHKVVFTDSLAEIPDTIIGSNFEAQDVGSGVKYNNTSAKIGRWVQGTPFDSIIDTIPACAYHGYADIVVTANSGTKDTVLSGICYTTTIKTPGWGLGESSWLGFPSEEKYNGRVYLNYWSKVSHVVQSYDSSLLYESLDSGRTFPNKIGSWKPTGDSAFDGSSYCIATVSGSPYHVMAITRWPNDMTHWQNVCYYRKVLLNSQGGYDSWNGPIIMSSDSAGVSGPSLGVSNSMKQLSNGTIMYVPYGGDEIGSNWEIWTITSTNLTSWTPTRIYKGTLNIDETTIEELKTNLSFQGKIRILMRNENSDSLYKMTSTDWGSTWSIPIAQGGGLKIDTLSPSQPFKAVPPASIRADDNSIIVFWGRNWFRSLDECSTWQDLGPVKQFSNTFSPSNKIYGDNCEVAPGLFFPVYCTNGITYSYPGWNWRTLPLNKTNSSVRWASNATKAWKITLDSTKIPTSGRITFPYDCSRISDSSWWNALPASCDIQIFDLSDSIFLPVSPLRYLNKTGKSGIIQLSSAVYGKNKTFLLQTGPSITSNQNFGAFYSSGITHVWSMDDTDGIIRDEASQLSALSYSNITQNQAGKLGKAIKLNNTSGQMTLPPLYTLPYATRFLMSFLIKENPTNYGNADAGFFRWYQGPITYLQVYRETNGGKDSLYVENHYASINGQIDRLSYTDYVDTSKYFHFLWLYDCYRPTDSSINQFFINAKPCQNYKVSAIKNTSGFPGCYTNPLIYLGPYSGVGLYDQFMFGTNFDTLQEGQLAKTLFYSQVYPDSFWINESLIADSIAIQLADITIDTIRVKTAIFQQGYTLNKPVRCDTAYFITTDSMTVSKKIYVKWYAEYSLSSKVGTLSGGMLLPYPYPTNILTIKLNGKNNTIPILPKNAITYKSYIKFR
jgi:hypothetical protein